MWQFRRILQPLIIGLGIGQLLGQLLSLTSPEVQSAGMIVFALSGLVYASLELLDLRRMKHESQRIEHECFHAIAIATFEAAQANAIAIATFEEFQHVNGRNEQLLEEAAVLAGTNPNRHQSDRRENFEKLFDVARMLEQQNHDLTVQQFGRSLCESMWEAGMMTPSEFDKLKGQTLTTAQPGSTHGSKSAPSGS